jgi:hypothetical protein
MAFTTMNLKARNTAKDDKTKSFTVTGRNTGYHISVKPGVLARQCEIRSGRN